jgi:hypothetical protein
MKNRAHVKELNDSRLEVVWPAPYASFHHFKHLLKRVIEANFDPPVAKTLEYSEEEKLFYITLTVGSTLAGTFSDNCMSEDHRTGLKLERLVEIFPLLPLGCQLTAAMEAHERLKSRHALLQLLFNEHMGQK